MVGTVKEPSLEEILALSPDFVVLSADVASQVKLHGALEAAEVPHAYYRVDAFADYLAMLGQFCRLTGREDLYETGLTPYWRRWREKRAPRRC